MFRAQLCVLYVLFITVESPAFAWQSGDYIKMAEYVASPTFDSYEEASGSYSDSYIMLRNEVAIQVLDDWQSDSSAIENIRRDVVKELRSCSASLREIRRLSASTPNYEAIAADALRAAPALLDMRRDEEGNLNSTDSKNVGNLYATMIKEFGSTLIDQINASLERDKYADYSESAWRAGRGLAKVAADYSGPVSSEALLSVDIDGSWGGFYNSDFVYYKNISGRDLNGVTLVVELNGVHGSDNRQARDSHVHYIHYWPSGATRVVRYMSTGASGIARDESVDQIQKLSYALLSREVTDKRDHQYTTAQFDKDVRRYTKEMSLGGAWHTYDPDAWFFNSGFLIRNMDRGLAFPCESMVVRASWGEHEIGYRWKFDGHQFPSGTSDQVLGAKSDGRYLQHPDFNRGKPDQVKITVDFPHTDYERVFTWDYE